MTATTTDPALTARAADFICRRHVDAMAATMMWPADYDRCIPCVAYWDRMPTGGVHLLPHIDAGWCVAVHEAAHAVVYICHLDVTVNYASALPNPDSGYLVGGYVNVQLAPNDFRPTALWAGQVALHRMVADLGPLTRADRVDVACNGRYDLWQMRQTGATDAALLAVRSDVETIVGRLWPRIVTVAEALLSQPRLSGDQIRALCGMA